MRQPSLYSSISNSNDSGQRIVSHPCRLCSFITLYARRIYFQQNSLLVFPSTDLVGIPDFMAGAMENWGLITFRETMLLVGNHSSPMDKQLVSSVIAHELAHQVCNIFSARTKKNDYSFCFLFFPECASFLFCHVQAL